MQVASMNASPGYLIGLAATVLLSFTGIVISYLNRSYRLPALVLAFRRDFFLAVGLATVFALFSRRRFRLERSLAGFFVRYWTEPGALQHCVDIFGAIQRCRCGICVQS